MRGRCRTVITAMRLRCSNALSLQQCSVSAESGRVRSWQAASHTQPTSHAGRGIRTPAGCLWLDSWVLITPARCLSALWLDSWVLMAELVHIRPQEVQRGASRAAIPSQQRIVVTAAAGRRQTDRYAAKSAVALPWCTFTCVLFAAAAGLAEVSTLHCLIPSRPADGNTAARTPHDLEIAWRTRNATVVQSTFSTELGEWPEFAGQQIRREAR